MDVFLKAVAAVLITVILCLVLAKQGKDFSLLLSIVVCCMVIIAAVAYLNPVLTFLQRLTHLAEISTQMLGVLMKAVGIALLAEITELVCKDAGNNALGRSIQLLACAVILWLSIPLLNELIDLMETILSNT